MSTDSMSSINSASSACSGSSQQSSLTDTDSKKKKKNWVSRQAYSTFKLTYLFIYYSDPKNIRIYYGKSRFTF